MNPEILLITTPSVNFRDFLGVCIHVLGYSPSQSAEASPRELSESAKFLSCLAAMRIRKPRQVSQPVFSDTFLFSVFVVADERDLLEFLSYCTGMLFVPAETTVRGVMATVVTGTLEQWRVAVAAGSVPEARPPVRAGFNKLYALFRREGLNVWGDYRTREAADHTLLLEYKPRP